jgi:glycerol-3-phosphate acyltransferase PlsX
LLSSSSLNYVGFIEGSKILSGKADVIVTDGFTGNIALKTMEGTAKHFMKSISASINRDWFSKLQGMFVKPILKKLSLEMDSRHYNGASLVGLNGIVIKSHGDADSYAFQRAIETALVEVKNQMPQQIKKLLEQEKI